MQDAIEPVYPEYYVLPAAGAAKVARGIVKGTAEKLERWRAPPEEVVEEIARNRNNIEKAIKTVEKYLGGKGKILRNKDGDI